ncbi:MAG: hypothetical protein K0U98_02155 [Deltaproteobacteria bacterium]|nr:hypothetical protein [Deltaproteobacteria bacterium]
MTKSRLFAVLIPGLFLCLLFAPCLIASGAAQAQVLASGTYDLQFSTGPGSPTFNSALTRMHTLPGDLGATAGARLVVSLIDLSRPDQDCDPDDPSGGIFEGCAVVDWPFPGRRGINLIEAQLTTGFETFHLRMGDVLSDEPEPSGP